METLPTRPTATALVTSAGDRLAPLLVAWKANLDSPGTAYQYGRIVERFFDDPAILAATGGDPRRVEPAHVYAFATAASSRDGETASPSTRIVRMAALGNFFGFLQDMNLVERNPADKLKRPKNESPAPKGVSTSELHRLLAAIPDSDSGRRDRAVVVVMVLAGLRRAEALGLRRGNLEEQDGATYYRTKVKGGRERYRELPAPALEAIRAYWRSRGRELEELAAEERLLPVSDSVFYRNLARYAEHAGLEHVTPHAMRHTSAKLRRQTGATLEEVQEHLGHRSVATTALYLRRMEGAKDEGWRAVADMLELDG